MPAVPVPAPISRWTALRAVALMAALGLAGGAAHAQVTYTPGGDLRAGSVISSAGTFSGLIDGTAAGFSVTSNTVTITVAEVVALLVTAGGVDDTTPGGPGAQTVYGAHGSVASASFTLTNTGNGSEAFSASAVLSGAPHGGALPALGYALTQAGLTAAYTPGAPITLEPGEQVTVTVSFTLPAFQSPDQPLTAQLSAQDSTGTVTDSDNHVQVSAVPDLALSLGDAAPQSVQQMGGARGVMTLSNLGNVPLNAGNVTLHPTLPGKPGGLTLEYGFQETGTRHATPQAALQDAPDIAPGAAADLRVWLTTGREIPDGGGFTLGVTAAPTPQGDANGNGLADETTGGSDSGQMAISTRAIDGRAVKQQGVCAEGGGSCSPLSSGGVDVAEAAPCSLVYYSVAGVNRGSGNLARPTLEDHVPAGVRVMWASARHLSLSGAPRSTPARVKLGSGPWMGVLTDADLSGADGHTPALLSAMLDSDGDGVPSDADLLSGSSLQLRIVGQVQGAACAAPDHGQIFSVLSTYAADIPEAGVGGPSSN